MNDIEISKNAKKLPIIDIAHSLNIKDENIILYGNDKSKINVDINNKRGKLILVTAINPTPYGEGKTTVSIGVCDALCSLGKRAMLALREPSMGPVFGMKGGATGGGYSQVIPMEDINLFFTGDMPAIEAANNLLCAAIDNHIHFGNNLDIKKVTFRRCVDVNDRSLRDVVINEQRTSFTITAASEVMAILCLSNDVDDLREKLGNIVIGYDSHDNMVFARDLGVVGSMVALLKDAIKPNLVQTLENNPALIHGGPFANIAHGCSSIIATKTALSLSDYVVTEAGFGADLGAEKFFDIKCRMGDIKPDCVLVVATVRSLKYNASISKEDILIPNVDAVVKGLSNLGVHIDNMRKFNSNVMVVLNKFDNDTVEEVNAVRDFCNNKGILFSISTAYTDGSKGAIEVAKNVLDILNLDNEFRFLYDINMPIKEKISIVAKEIYRANDIEYSCDALESIDKLSRNNLTNLPICVAKTQYSLSDDAKRLGAGYKHTIHVKDVVLYSGAGFIVVYLNNIISMPALSKKPNYLNIDYVDDEIVGLS